MTFKHLGRHAYKKGNTTCKRYSDCGLSCIRVCLSAHYSSFRTLRVATARALSATEHPVANSFWFHRRDLERGRGGRATGEPASRQSSRHKDPSTTVYWGGWQRESHGERMRLDDEGATEEGRSPGRQGTARQMHVKRSNHQARNSGLRIDALVI